VELACPPVEVRVSLHGRFPRRSFMDGEDDDGGISDGALPGRGRKVP